MGIDLSRYSSVIVSNVRGGLQGQDRRTSISEGLVRLISFTELNKDDLCSFSSHSGLLRKLQLLQSSSPELGSAEDGATAQRTPRFPTSGWSLFNEQCNKKDSNTERLLLFHQQSVRGRSPAQPHQEEHLCSPIRSVNAAHVRKDAHVSTKRSKAKGVYLWEAELLEIFR